jgi:hypothetical protein
VLESVRGSATIQIMLVVSFAAVILAVAVYIVWRARRKPKDKEKRRRFLVNQEGRLGDATITEVHESTIFYEYSVRGVIYTASQDVAQLREHIPSDLERHIGPVTLKYSPRNPANSIIVCEEWSGLRGIAPAKPVEP